jgi:murein DD-endopeptidase MepM/ murein hydrolase activator NlpD
LTSAWPCLLTTLMLWSAPAAAKLSVEVSPASGRPGDAVMFVVRGAKKAPKGTLGNRKLNFVPMGKRFVALTGLPVELEPGQLEFKVSGTPIGAKRAVELEGELEVVAPNFNSRHLTVDSKYIEPPKKVKRRIKEDRAAFKRAFAQPIEPPKFKRNFAWPRVSIITAPYGDKRTFNNRKPSQHFGIDLDGDTGAPIYASNDGTVVMARDCYASGNTVLLYHGAGLYSAYFHMSKIRVKDGDKVRRGQLLGDVGKTGRVTGPHLHWGIKVDGLWVDGRSLLRLDFD